jgi:hypothetical protein
VGARSGRSPISHADPARGVTPVSVMAVAGGAALALHASTRPGPRPPTLPARVAMGGFPQQAACGSAAKLHAELDPEESDVDGCSTRRENPSLGANPTSQLVEWIQIGLPIALWTRRDDPARDE